MSLTFRIIMSLSLISLVACNNSDDFASRLSIDEDEIIARVNGEPITAYMLNRHAETRGSGESAIDQKLIIEELINLTLLRQDAMRLGLDGNVEVIQEIERQTIAVLANQVIQQQTESVSVSETNLRQEYSRQIANMPKEYRARHILVKTEAEANELLEKLGKGSDFAKLAAKESLDPSGKKGGDLDWFRLDAMVEPFSLALSQLSKGETTSKAVQTQFGWHIIKLEDTRELGKPEFDSVKEPLKRIVVNNHLHSYVNELRKTAQIDIKSKSDVAEEPAQTSETEQGSGDY